MLDAECVVGARVICVSSTQHGKYTGMMGTIDFVRRAKSGLPLSYLVVDNAGNYIGGYGWCSLLSWDINTGLTRFPMTGFKICQPPKNKECPCGITRSDCDYHKD